MDIKPKFRYLITYLCTTCGFDFAVAETETPRCFYCDAEKQFFVLKKEMITPEILSKRMKLVMDRLDRNVSQLDTDTAEMDNSDLSDEEINFLLKRTQNLKISVSKLKEKMDAGMEYENLPIIESQSGLKQTKQKKKKFNPV